MYFLFAIYNLILYLLSMLNKKFQIGQTVDVKWSVSSKSKKYQPILMGAKVVGFTKKRIIIDMSSLEGYDRSIVYMLPKNVYHQTEKQ